MYVVFEGIDELGKTTQIDRVMKSLPKQIVNVPIKRIAETEIKFNKSTPIEVKILKFAIQRYKKNIHKINPKNRKEIILSDRSYLSSLAYQGIDEHYRKLVYQFNNEMPQPFLTFYFKSKHPPKELVEIQKNYEEILPYNCRTIVFGEHNKNQTTKFITNQIVKQFDILNDRELKKNKPAKNYTKNYTNK